ncbi:MAG: hypothetical protein AAGK28_01430 [Pseudomonadota bacterium]
MTRLKDRSASGPFAKLICDSFEADLLPVLRCLVASLSTADPTLWQKATSKSIEHWGDALGHPIAHRLGHLVIAVYRCREGKLDLQQPWAKDHDDAVTDDEVKLITMLHHMRRDEVADARRAVDDLTFGIMDPDVIRAGLSFATRFSCGRQGQQRSTGAPKLSVVS